MYNPRKEMLAKPVYKTLLIILVVAVCFAFAYIKDASAYENLVGVLNHKPWAMGSAVLKKRTIDGIQNLVLEFSERSFLDSDICKDSLLDTEKLVIQIPVSIENGSMIPDYDNSTVRMNGSNDVNLMKCIHAVVLNMNDLNSAGKAFVTGNLKLMSGVKTKLGGIKTEIAGKFAARVCN